MELDPTAVLQPAPDLAVRTDGAVLIGGYPTRVLSLSPAGAAAVAAWFSGRPVGDKPAHRRLGWRLVDAGLADIRAQRDPVPSPGQIDGVTVVVPVKDDIAGLTRTLASLADRNGNSETASSDDQVAPPALPVIIVDDGSDRPINRSGLAAELGPSVARGLDLTVVRCETNRGPAAARNRGLDLVETPIVAFIDADVLVSRAQLRQLITELHEPNTVAVAPRVRPTPPGQTVRGRECAMAGPAAIAAYEQRWSVLDMGPRQAIVGPGRPVPYVPATCLVSTVSAMARSRGFDEHLRYGEDVDLVWRLTGQGWVRYVPSIEIVHPPRQDLPALARQRFRYGTAASALARRHPRSMAPLKIAPAMAIGLLGILERSPLLFVAGAATALRRLRPRLEPTPNPTAESLWLVFRGLRHSAIALSTATVRVWWPLLCLLAVVWPPLRPRVLILLAAGTGRRLRPDTPLSIGRDLAIGAVDDASYALGVWTGAIRHRDPAAIIPDLSTGPSGARQADEPPSETAGNATGR